MANPYDAFDEPETRPLTGPDPMRPAQIRKSHTDARIAELEERIKTADANTAGAISSAQRDKAIADAQRAQAELKTMGMVSADKRDEMRANLNSLNLLRSGIEELEKLYKGNFAGKGIDALAEYLPGPMRPANAQMNDAGNRLAAFISKALELTGKQFDTPREQQLFIQSYLPKNTDRDEQIESKIAKLTELYNNAGRGMAQRLGTEFTPYEGEGRLNPLDKKMAAQVDAMINAKVPLEAINAALAPQGYGPVNSADYDEALRWKAKYPKQRFFGAKAVRSQGGPGGSPLVQGLSGMNEGLAAVAGAPADLGALVLNTATQGVNGLAGLNIPRIDRPFLGSEQIGDFLTRVGSIRPPGFDSTGQLFRRVGQSVGAAAIPLAGPATTLPRLGAQALMGAGGGVGGYIADRAFPGNPLAEMAGELAGGGLTASGIARSVRGRAQAQLNDAVPTVAELKREASNLYKTADARGVAASPKQTRQLSRDFEAALAAEGRVSPTGRVSEVYPKVKEARQLISDYAGKKMTAGQIQSVRKVIGDGLSSVEPAERRLAGILVDTFDNITVPIAPELKQARGVASRYLTAQQLEKARELAASRASQFTGSGFENALRTEYRQLDRAGIRGSKRFTQDVTDAIEKVARGTPASNFARGVGRLAPTGVVSGLGSLLPGMGAAAQFGPVAGGIVGGGMMTAGMAGRSVATKMGIKAADEAELIARNGGSLPNVELPPDWREIMRRVAAGELLKYLPDQQQDAGVNY